MGRKRGEGKWQRPHRPISAQPSQDRIEVGVDGFDYHVRTIPGARAVKAYRCPGCDHEIRNGVPHLVVWPADSGESAADDRRHWHTPCWANRGNRGPTRRWS